MFSLPHKLFLGTFLSLVLACPAIASEKRVSEIIDGPAGNAMNTLLERAETFGWSGQVLVESEGTVVLRRAYGFAERTEREPMTLDTPIGVASISKQFVASAILALEQEDRLSLSDPVSRYVSEMHDLDAAITIDHLLSHTAGLRGGDIAGTDFEIPSREVLLERVAATPPTGEPGTSWRYSNAGYNLLAAVIESITGEPYERYLSERLFRPAGMNRTGFWHEPPARAPVAHAYRGWVDQGSPESWPRNWRTYGTGDVLSTVTDLHRWEVALRNHAVLSAESVQLLRSPHASIGNSGDAYGYGWFLHLEENGGYVFEHGGDWLGGFNGFYWVDPARELTILILNNASDAAGMWMRQHVQKSLIDIVKGTEIILPPPTTGSAAGAPLDGEYRLDSGGSLRVFDDGAYLWIAALGQEAVNLLAGVDPEEAVTLERVAERTRSLFSALNCGDRDAFAIALGEGGRPHLDDYVAEWNDAVDRLGALQSFEILGVAPGRSARSIVKLQMAEGEIVISCFWADRGTGRLHGTHLHEDPAAPYPYPVAYIAAYSASDRLTGYDLFAQRGVEIQIQDGGRLQIRSLDGGGSAVARSSRNLAQRAVGAEP